MLLIVRPPCIHSRSSTGEGIFVFGTQQSVLITHTLETVIEMLAKQKKERQGAPVQVGYVLSDQFSPLLLVMVTAFSFHSTCHQLAVLHQEASFQELPISLPSRSYPTLPSLNLTMEHFPILLSLDFLMSLLVTMTLTVKMGLTTDSAITMIWMTPDRRTVV